MKKMKKKGFTLIETLGVIILLGIIALITVPVFKDTLKDSKQKLYDEQVAQIEQGLKNWAHANIFLLPEDNHTIKLSLGQLSQTGHIDYEIKNPKTNKCFSNESILTIAKYNNTYIYKAEEMIDVDCDLVNSAPTIKLNGNVVEYLNIGDTYTELGATAKDSSGTDITSSITITITGSGTDVDTSTAGTYAVTYDIVSDEKIMTAIRTVIVK